MQDGWTTVYDSRARQSCSDRSLVLLSVGIPNETLATEDGHCYLAVPEPLAEKAKFEIWQYDQENQVQPPQVRALTPNYEGAIPGVLVYIIIVVLVAWTSGTAAFGYDWLGAGRIDGSLVRDGEWWRVVTALTLHGGIKHILGNIVFGTVFGLLAGGLVGPGIAWLSIVLAASLANTLNVFLLDATHRSIGASTAVFAALGIVSGFVWRGKLMAQERWAWRLGPIVGGIALLAYTGTGDANTDVGAHLAGFACGFGTGSVLSKLPKSLDKPRAQSGAGLFAIALVSIAWMFALRGWQ